MFVCKLADVIIGIDNKYDFSKEKCSSYICENEDPELTVSVTKEEIDCELARNPDEERGYAEFIALYRKICNKLIPFGIFMLHASVIEANGYGVAFSAPSGTGKTTHTYLWRRAFGEQVNIVNGDKPLVRIRDGKFYAYGTPWCGKENLNRNVSVPLKAILFLERGDTDIIEKADVNYGFERLFRQVLMPTDSKNTEALINLIIEMSQSVDIYKMKCTKSENAAKTAYEKIFGGLT